MNNNYALKKRIFTAIMATLSFVLSTFVYFPNFAPFQHFINVICAVTLGPWYGFLAALLTGILRIALTGKTVLAIIGAVFGALLSGLLYKASGKMFMAVIGEIIGTGIISALVAAPVMKYGFGVALDSFWYYIPFFLPACAIGAGLGYAVLLILYKSGILNKIQNLLDTRS